MRSLLVCLLFCACDDTGSSATDLSATSDLAAASDLAGAGCSETETCIEKCTAANVGSCVPACISQLAPPAQSYFNALEACARPGCTQLDGGAGPCLDPSSTACQSCVAQKCGSELAACQAH
jgi:hypothetical protein